MPKQEYNVAVSVIEVWHVTVEAENEDEALDKARDLDTDVIRKTGSLQLCETDYHELC